MVWRLNRSDMSLPPSAFEAARTGAEVDFEVLKFQPAIPTSPVVKGISPLSRWCDCCGIKHHLPGVLPIRMKAEVDLAPLTGQSTRFNPIVINPITPIITAAIIHSATFSFHALCFNGSVSPQLVNSQQGAQQVITVTNMPQESHGDALC